MASSTKEALCFHSGSISEHWGLAHPAKLISTDMKSPQRTFQTWILEVICEGLYEDFWVHGGCAQPLCASDTQKAFLIMSRFFRPFKYGVQKWWNTKSMQSKSEPFTLKVMVQHPRRGMCVCPCVCCVRVCVRVHVLVTMPSETSMPVCEPLLHLDSVMTSETLPPYIQR